MPNNSDRLILSAVEAAKLIHPDMSVRTLESWRMRGAGPRFVRLGRRIGYTRQAIEDYIERQTREHTAQEKGRGN